MASTVAPARGERVPRKVSRAARPRGWKQNPRDGEAGRGWSRGYWLAAAKPRSNRRIIDVSGDGTNNSGRPVTEARDQAVAEGVTINGLAIINDRPNPGYAFHTQPPGGLPEWYRQNVIGGPGSFLRVIDDFRSFSDAMTNKLVSEIVALAGEEQTASVP